jgi:hypothetical protein
MGQRYEAVRSVQAGSIGAKSLRRMGAGHDDDNDIEQGRIGELVRLGCLGFGGPVALVGQMERELVDGKKWLTKEQMREAIAICQ